MAKNSSLGSSLDRPRKEKKSPFRNIPYFCDIDQLIMLIHKNIIK